MTGEDVIDGAALAVARARAWELWETEQRLLMACEPGEDAWERGWRSPPDVLGGTDAAALREWSAQVEARVRALLEAMR